MSLNWTDEEIAVISSHPELNGKELSLLLVNRSYEAVQQKRRLLGLNYLAKKWSQSELDYLKDHRHDSAEGVAGVLGRPVESVMVKRQETGTRRLTYCYKCGCVIPKRNQFQSCPSCKKTQKDYNSDPKARFRQYVHSAKKRGYLFNLAFEEFLAFYHEPCAYCGDPFEGVGIDRVDNSKGYEKDNIVSCCEWCNRMKLNYNKEDWLKKITQIANNHKENTCA